MCHLLFSDVFKTVILPSESSVIFIIRCPVLVSSESSEMFIVQVQIVTVLTTETKQFSTERNETDLRQAGRMACDSGGYLCKMASDDHQSSVEEQLDGLKQFFEPQRVVGNLMKSLTMSVIDRRPAVTLSRKITYQGPL